MSKPRGKPFQPGNKFGKGRPKGSRNKTALLSQKLLEEHAESITRRCIQQALRGHTVALKLCMERVAPAQGERRVRMKLPSVATAQGVDIAEERIVQLIVSGDISPHQGGQMIEILEKRRKAIETANLAPRLEDLEEAARNKGW